MSFKAQLRLPTWATLLDCISSALQASLPRQSFLCTTASRTRKPPAQSSIAVVEVKLQVGTNPVRLRQRSRTGHRIDLSLGSGSHMWNGQRSASQQNS